jgi:hypothetical protein
MSLDERQGHEASDGNGLNFPERILKRKDGSTLPVELSTSVVYNKKNKPVYILSIARDVSDRRQYEETIKRYTRILSVISDATVRLLRSSNIEKKIPETLEALGLATDVSNCSVLEIETFSSTPTINIRYWWQKRGDSRFDISSIIASHSYDP